MREITRIELTKEQQRALWGVAFALDDIAANGPPGATIGQLVRVGEDFVAVRFAVLTNEEAMAVQAIIKPEGMEG